MEEYKWILITVICYLAALFYDIVKRDRASEFSPKKFNLSFFFKDNKNRLIFSFLLSLSCALVFWLIAPDVAAIPNNEIGGWGSIIYAIIGGAPDLAIAYAKRKTDFLRPQNVDGYQRKIKTEE